MSLKDKNIEKMRYDERAILNSNSIKKPDYGSKSISEIYREPYIYYEKIINQYLTSSLKVLEVGSGMGLHTYSLLATGATVIATDLSEQSLEILKKVYSETDFFERLQIKKADIEDLPFRNNSFDIVTCAGSLSYGNSSKVDNEINRVLKPNGYFISIDSLNNNIIFKNYRLVQWIIGRRTKLTYKNMPTMQRLKIIGQKYSNIDIKYFGSLMYLGSFLSIILDEKFLAYWLHKLDLFFNIKSSAYKFVLVAKK